jgi:hypothetical protein
VINTCSSYDFAFVSAYGRCLELKPSHPASSGQSNATADYLTNSASFKLLVARAFRAGFIYCLTREASSESLLDYPH